MFGGGMSEDNFKEGGNNESWSRMPTLYAFIWTSRFVKLVGDCYA
jgi:hypothetical protein